MQQFYILAEFINDNLTDTDSEKMTRYKATLGAKCKRIQSTPTSRRKAALATLRTGKILRKLVQMIVETIPEVQREVASYNLMKYKMKKTAQYGDSSLEDEECLTMMMGLKLDEKEEQHGKENTLCRETKNIMIGNGVQAPMRIILPEVKGVKRGINH